MRKFLRIAWITFGVIFLIWNWATFQAWAVPEGTFEDDSTVSVREDGDKFTFIPRENAQRLQVIFLQGGMTDLEAYGPLCRVIASNGFTCHLLKMPWRLPRYGYQDIATMFDLRTNDYVLAGHSQGAMAAGQFVYENPEAIRGLILIGTSHPKDIDLSNLSIPAMKIYASNDGLASVPEVNANKNKLPPGARFILVEGGNHSQFGYLGKLLLDDKASISREAQQKITADSVVGFLRQVDSQLF